MIVDCPHCHTSNSESDNASGPDGTVVCRSCGRRFQAPQQAHAVGGNTTQVARPEQLDEVSEITDAEQLLSFKTGELGKTLEASLPAQVQETRISEPPKHDEGGEGPTRIAQSPHERTDDSLVTTVGEVHSDAQDHTVANSGPVPMPREEGTGRTGVMSQTQLYRALIEVESIEPEEDTVPPGQEPADSTRRQSAGAGRPGQPSTGSVARPWVVAVRNAAQHYAELFMEQPRPVRIASGIGALLLLLLLIVSIRLATRSSVSIAYAAEIQALLSAPVEGARPNGAMGNLRRGEQVTVFDSVGDFVMVRDLQGRVGYVQETGLVKERPASPPDSAFVDCKPAAAEADMHGCEGRAEQQWESCLSLCEKANALSKCNDDCRGQYRVCLAACHGEAVHPEPGPPTSAPPPEPAPPTSRPTDVRAAPVRSEAVHSTKPKTSASSKKSDKKKKH